MSEDLSTVPTGELFERLWLWLPDWARRAAWTFLQAFGAAEVAAAATWLAWPTIKISLLAAGAAAISVAKSGFVAWWRARRPVSEPANAKGSESP